MHLFIDGFTMWGIKKLPSILFNEFFGGNHCDARLFLESSVIRPKNAMELKRQRKEINIIWIR
jgi:hypothetical protein